MADLFQFRTANGRMFIDPDKFFPATKSDLRDLLKIINHPVTGEGSDKILECIDYLEEQIYYLKEAEVEYSDLIVSDEYLNRDEFSLYYLQQRNKLVDKILWMIKSKKSKYQSNIEQLKGGIKS